MPPDPDLLAAELTAIGARAEEMRRRDVWTRVRAVEADRDRLLLALSAVADTASEAEHGTIGGGSEWAGQIREAAVSKLLGEERGAEFTAAGQSFVQQRVADAAIASGGPRSREEVQHTIDEARREWRSRELLTEEDGHDG
jgi:hypothetical protein